MQESNGRNGPFKGIGPTNGHLILLCRRGGCDEKSFPDPREDAHGTLYAGRAARTTGRVSSFPRGEGRATATFLTGGGQNFAAPCGESDWVGREGRLRGHVWTESGWFKGLEGVRKVQ